jgi:hypothetical protein
MPWAHIYTSCSVGRFRTPLALVPKKSVALQAARRSLPGVATSVGQVPSAAVTTSVGGQQEAGVWEASTMVMGQPATIVVPTATAAQADLLAARVVYTNSASATPVTGVAQPIVIMPT